MEQQQGIFDPRSHPIPVKEDYGPISTGDDAGVTGARRVLGVNGREYAAKSDSWMAGGVTGAHVLLQEWICARLAESIGVPIPEFTLLDFNGVLCFGSRWLPHYADRFVPQLLDRVINPHDLYRIAVFDAWVMNQDRHDRNLIVVTVGEDPTLIAIDHSHCPLFGVEPFNELQRKLNRPATMAIRPFISRHLTDRALLARSVHSVQTLGDQCIWALTSPPSHDSCTEQEHEMLADFLIQRRDALPSLFNITRDAFPAIKDTPL